MDRSISDLYRNCPYPFSRKRSGGIPRWLQTADRTASKRKNRTQEIPRKTRKPKSYPVETNQIFFSAPASWVPLIQDKIHCYLWDRKKNILRFITSWNTLDEKIRHLKQILEELSHHPI